MDKGLEYQYRQIQAKRRCCNAQIQGLIAQKNMLRKKIETLMEFNNVIETIKWE